MQTCISKHCKNNKKYYKLYDFCDNICLCWHMFNKFNFHDLNIFVFSFRYWRPNFYTNESNLFLPSHVNEKSHCLWATSVPQMWARQYPTDWMPDNIAKHTLVVHTQFYASRIFYTYIQNRLTLKILQAKNTCKAICFLHALSGYM